MSNTTFVYEDYTDVRLEHPENVANFGGDTDNFLSPGIPGFFPLFRAHADDKGSASGIQPAMCP
jgi:hypothetical protein